MIRVPTPPDHNDTLAVFARTSSGNGEIHQPITKFEVVVYALIACICIWFIVVPLAKKPYTEVQTVAEKPATTPCGNGFATEWVDEFTITCNKETR